MEYFHNISLKEFHQHVVLEYAEIFFFFFFFFFLIQWRMMQVRTC